MKLNDNCSKPAYEGIFKLERSTKGGPWSTEEFSNNLVVNKASEILRDLMFGDVGKIIGKVHFGDMGLTENDDLRNIDSPNPTDTSLINKLYEKNATKKKIIYKNSPAIEYSVVLDENEFNGSGTQLITEYALANGLNEIFARKTRAAVYKDNESSLRFTWTLVFN